MNALFGSDVPRTATPMDRTSAVAREITDAATRLRAENTARLRAARLERAAPEAARAKKAAAKPRSGKE